MEINKKYLIVIIVITVISVITNCKKEKKDDTLMNLLILNSLADAARGPSCENCYCNVNSDGAIKTSAAYCVKYSNKWGTKEAETDCKKTGTFTTTTCSNVNSVGSCSAYSKEISFYSIPESSIYYKSSGSFNECHELFSGTFTYSTLNPKIRFKNNSGSTETYSIHSNANCGSSTLVKTVATNVANGATTDYVELTNTQTADGSTYFYAISYDGGTNCSEGKYIFSKGIQWTIASGSSTYTISAP